MHWLKSTIFYLGIFLISGWIIWRICTFFIPIIDEILIFPNENPINQEPTIVELIEFYSFKYNINPELPLKIAWCESGYNPLAKNPNSSASGVFQIIDSTLKICERYFDRQLNQFDAEDNIECGIWLLTAQGSRHWYPTESCWNN